MNTKNANQYGKELLAEKRVYSNEEIEQIIFGFSSNSGIGFRYGVIADMFKSHVREQIFFFASLIVFINNNEEIDEEDREHYSTTFAHVITDLAKEIK
ncbi:MAG: hypothetical protein RR517_06485 [Pseudomonas sp.]